MLPDRWPALQALAGPLGAIVWLSVAALQVWVLWQSRLITARAIEGWSLSRITIAIVAASMLAAGLAAMRLTSTALFPSGDEPHYLVIAQSLWRDGDLKIENNHQRGDYHEYYADRSRAALPDSWHRRRDLLRSSDRHIGPAHADLRSRRLPARSAVLMLMAAIALAIAWRWTIATLNAAGAATFAWAAIALTAPYLFNIVHGVSGNCRGAWR